MNFSTDKIRTRNINFSVFHFWAFAPSYTSGEKVTWYESSLVCLFIYLFFSSLMEDYTSVSLFSTLFWLFFDLIPQINY